MASTYTTDLAIQLMATGENAGTWGQITNTNLVVVQQAIAGYESISIAGGAQTTALVMTQNSLATARNAVIKLTGTITGNQIVTVPGSAASGNLEKTWIVSNGTVGAFTVTFKYAGTGTGQTWSTTDKGIKILYADGSDIQVADLSTLSGSIVAAQITNSTITQAKLASNSIGTAQLQTGAVTAVKITQSTITQSKLAANSVGSSQLISTGVVAGSYTTTSLTVDADGRITAASSGAAAASAGMGIPVLFSVGPTSGTYTATPAASRAGIYLYAGGGGGGAGGNSNPRPGGNGGGGGFAFYNKPFSQPFAQPFAVGAGGAGAPPGNLLSGSAGGATNLANVGTVNAGNGGSGNATTPGNNGTTPGSSFTYPVRDFVIGGSFGAGGAGGAGNENTSGAGGAAGAAGVIVIFENTGT
jgi:hypothetical protein